MHVLVAAYFGHTGEPKKAASTKVIRGNAAREYDANVEAMMRFFDSASSIATTPH